MEMKDYHGTVLAADEWQALHDLEQKIGRTPLERAEHADQVDIYLPQFTAAGGHVTGVFLYDFPLTSLPETIMRRSKALT